MRKLINSGITLAFSQTARSTYILFTGNTLDAFFAFLFTVFTFRLLTTADFGIFSAINNFVVLSFSILDIGIGGGLINFVSYHYQRGNVAKARNYFKAGLLLRATVAAIFAATVISLSWFIAPKFFLTQSYPAVMLAGVAILGLSLLDIVTFSLQAYQKFLFSAIASTSFSLSRVVLILSVMAMKLPYSITTAMVFTTTAPIIGFLLGLKFLRFSPSESHPGKEVYKSLLSFSGWIGINKIASSIAGRLDVQMLLLLAGPTITGIYSVATRIASFYAVIVTSFAAVLAPKLSSGRPLRELRPLLSRAALAILGLILAMGLGILIAKPFILLLFGQKAAGSVTPFQALTLANIPFVASSLAVAIIIYNLKKPIIIGLLSIFQVLSILLGNLLLIPRYSVFGPIIALGFTHAVVLLVTSSVILYHWKKNGSTQG